MSETLSKSPLTLVLTRVQFAAELTALSDGETPAIDAALLPVGFPAASTVTDATIQLTPSGPAQVKQGNRRVYQDAEGGLHVVVAPHFIAMYASRASDHIAYSGHAPFLDKFKEVITALMPLVGAMPVVKTGYRYVDQLVGGDLDNVEDLISPTCRGVVPTNVPQGAQLLASVLRAQFSYDNSGQSHREILQVQSGQIPKGQPVDRGIPALEETSWALDIDASSFTQIKFTATDVIAAASKLQQRAKNFFSTVAVTSEFEERFR